MPSSKAADLTADTAPVDTSLVVPAQAADGSADFAVALSDMPVSTPQATADAAVLAAAIPRTAHTGSQAISTVTGLQAALDAKIPLTQKAAASGVASLDANGKVPVTQIPSTAFSSVDVVASQAAMLALSAAVEGALAIRTDNDKSYVLSTNSPGTLADWIEFSSGGDVASVDGLTGTVSLAGSYDALGAANAAKARATHTGTQSADTITDGSTNHVFTAADDTKLGAIEAGATKGIILYEYDGAGNWVRNTTPVKIFVNRIDGDDTTPAEGSGDEEARDGIDILLIGE